MSEPIRFLDCNIEGSRHLERVASLIRKRAPEIITLQEVYQGDIPFLTGILGHAAHFESMATQYDPKTGNYRPKGILTMWDKQFAEVENAAHRYQLYPNAHEQIPNQRAPNECDRVLLTTTFIRHGEQLRIGNTHFIWTPDGGVDDLQRRVFTALSSALEKYDDETGIILTGDFNAPRGLEIFDALATRYHDNIPAEIETTLDQTLHRVPNLRFVVDVLFSTPQYHISQVELVDGVSDHMSVTALIALG